MLRKVVIPGKGALTVLYAHEWFVNFLFGMALVPFACIYMPLQICDPGEDFITRLTTLKPKRESLSRIVYRGLAAKSLTNLLP